MATLTIRNIEPEVKQALRERAARHGVSMEEEARQAIRLVVSAMPFSRSAVAPEKSAWAEIEKLRERHGAFDIELPERHDVADNPPKFD